jgi:Zn-dependent protease
MSLDFMVILFVGAWFVQMGAHEGAHAWVAYWRGDETAYHLGKRTFNPLAHVNWKSINSILMAVGLPILTAMAGWIPMGMAWVPVNPRRLKFPSRDMALISLAGPMANFVIVILCLVLHWVLPGAGEFSVIPQSAIPKALWLFHKFLYVTALTSILYGVFNLVPIPPLDGSKVLRFFLPEAGRDIMDRLTPYGMWMIIAVFWMGDVSWLFQIPMMFIGVLW